MFPREGEARVGSVVNRPNNRFIPRQDAIRGDLGRLRGRFVLAA